MSRIGKLPIKIPNGVDVDVSKNLVKVKGPKGQLEQELVDKVKVEVKDGEIIVSVSNPDDKEERSFWGLFRALINNMIMGVTEGYEKKLEVVGVGYKVSVAGNKINLSLGFSHPVEFKLPDGISASAEGNILTISGIDKQVVGELAAQIRKLRKPEPYKGKGVRYVGEVVRRKAGKSAAAAK
jgi:large subunit ribosomal protein L6